MASCNSVALAMPMPSAGLLHALDTWTPPAWTRTGFWQLPISYALRVDAKNHTAEAPVTAPTTEAGYTSELERLYNKLESPLTNVLYRWLWDREEVQDVMQEAYVRLWRMRTRVDWSRAQPLLYKIALNLAASRKRSAALRRFVGFEEAGAPDSFAKSAPDRLAQEELEPALRCAIDGLGERHRRVLMLSEFTELSYEQIASALGISVGTVGSRRNTAIQKLKATMKRWEQGD